MVDQGDVLWTAVNPVTGNLFHAEKATLETRCFSTNELKRRTVDPARCDCALQVYWRYPDELCLGLGLTRLDCRGLKLIRKFCGAYDLSDPLMTGTLKREYCVHPFHLGRMTLPPFRSFRQTTPLARRGC